MNISSAFDTGFIFGIIFGVFLTLMVYEISEYAVKFKFNKKDK